MVQAGLELTTSHSQSKRFTTEQKRGKFTALYSEIESRGQEYLIANCTLLTMTWRMFFNQKEVAIISNHIQSPNSQILRFLRMYTI